MALFNEILVGRLNRWVQKFYAIKSGTASLTQLLPTVQTVNQVFSGNEDRYLQGWQRHAVTATAAAVAAQFSVIELRNPPGSGVVAIFEQVFVAVGAASLVQTVVSQTTSDRATIITILNSRYDARGNVPSSALIFSKGSAVALAPEGFNQFRGFANTATSLITTQNQEITVLPGDQIATFCELVNTQLSVSYVWRERTLESSELT